MQDGGHFPGNRSTKAPETLCPPGCQDIHDCLRCMPFPIATWVAAELRHIIREYKKSWHWYYNRAHDLWTYLDYLDFIVSQYPRNPQHLPLTTYASKEDADFVRVDLMDAWGRLDCTSEAIVWHQLGVHLPCWGPDPFSGSYRRATWIKGFAVLL